jgi:cytochrome c oxidase cbb3-type subunit 4
MTMDMETLRGLGTVFLMGAFLALCGWAFLPSNKRRFEQDGRLVFLDEEREESRTGGGE